MQRLQVLAESFQIDGIGMQDDGVTCLMLMDDHWGWNETDERYTLILGGVETPVMHDFVHIIYLFDKFYTYIDAIEDDDVVEKGAPRPQRYVIKLLSTYPMNERAEWFMDLVKRSCAKRSIAYEFELSRGKLATAERAEAEAAKQARRQRLAVPADGGDTEDCGREAHELRDTVWLEEFPPNIVRNLKMREQTDDDGDLADYSQNRAEVEELNRAEGKIEMVIKDYEPWCGEDDLDVDLLANRLDFPDMRHDFCHMLYLWRRAAWIFESWMHGKVPGLTAEDYRCKLVLKLVTTYPPNDRGKWFLDWLTRFYAMCRCTFTLELDASEEAHDLRQAAKRAAGNSAATIR
jgi:hypothetical protein